MVLNRSADLIESAKSLNQYRKAAQSIKEIRVKWNNRIKELEKLGYDNKEALNLRKDASKLQDLEFLKTRSRPIMYLLHLKTSS